MPDMTSPDKIDHRIRLTPESSAAAKQAAHDGYVSFNGWVQETIDQRLDRLNPADQLRRTRDAVFLALDALSDTEGVPRARTILRDAINLDYLG